MTVSQALKLASSDARPSRESMRRPRYARVRLADRRPDKAARRDARREWISE